MKQRTMLAALALGGLAAVSCLVYGPDDLRGAAGGSSTGGQGGGRGGDGGMTTIGGSAGTLGVAGAGSTSGGASGSPMGGSPATAGRNGGDGGAGEGGEDVGGRPNGGATAGSSGSGGGTAGGPVVPPKTLIDDLEDGDHRVRRIEDPDGVYRNGFWYTYANGSYVELFPQTNSIRAQPHPEGTPGPPDLESTKAFELRVREVEDEIGNGAAAGLNFLEPKGPYDASRYVGIAFWARANKEMTIRVQIATKGTDAGGGVCGEKCSDHFFMEHLVGTAWTHFEGRWDLDEFAQEGWGTPVEFAATELYSLQFFIPAFDTNPSADLWLDDVTFIEP